MGAPRLNVVLVLLGLLVAAPGAGAEGVRVGLLPVQVHSNDPDSGYLSQGLADMLSSRLEQSEAISVVRVAAEATTDAGAAVQAGRDAAVDYVVFGSFTQFGEGASLDVQCAPVTAGEAGEVAPGGRRIFVSSGTLAEIIPKLDELSDKVSRYLLGPPGARTSSPGVVAAGPGSAASGELDELRQRVDALERAVFYGEGASSAAPDEESDPAAGKPAAPE